MFQMSQWLLLFLLMLDVEGFTTGNGAFSVSSCSKISEEMSNSNSNSNKSDDIIRKTPPMPCKASSASFPRRTVLTTFTAGLLGGVGSPSLLLLLLLGDRQPAEAAEDDEESKKPHERQIAYKLKSGIQFRDLRVGNGPLVTQQVVSSDTTNDDDADNNDNQRRPTVVMHVQALLRDGTILMDTRQDNGRPILYELGSALDTVMARPGIVPPGLDDAIVSRGTLVGSNGERVEPMRQGGIRLVVVPADLAYGTDGLSRYQAWKLGGQQSLLKKPVPRDEILRYEIEILRCLEVLPIEVKSSRNEQEEEEEVPGISQTTVQACCSEEVYPCQGPPV
jgi:hypothetical protein